MVQANQFAGLTMPVFSAFGWSGEETAINFALDQLQMFTDIYPKRHHDLCIISFSGLINSFLLFNEQIASRVM